MKDENLPVVRYSTIPSQHELAVYEVMARKAADSRMYQELGGEAGILTIMLCARELDIPAMQAVSGGIRLIKGKVELAARTINMMIRKAGHTLKILEHTDQKCRIYGKRSDTGEEYESLFTVDMAKRAGIYRDNWTRYPEDMVFARAISRLGRFLFADVIGNSYVEGEIKDAIDVEVSETPKLTPKPINFATSKQTTKVVHVAPAHIVEPEPEGAPQREKEPLVRVDAPVEEEPEIKPAEPAPKKVGKTPATVKECLDRFFGYLTKQGVQKGGTDHATELITQAFDVDYLDEIQDRDVEALYEYVSGEVLRVLKEDKWLGEDKK